MGWIKCSERLPEQNPESVYFVVDGVVMEGKAYVYWDSRTLFVLLWGHGYLSDKVSHWMPKTLPAPPEREQPLSSNPL